MLSKIYKCAACVDKNNAFCHYEKTARSIDGMGQGNGLCLQLFKIAWFFESYQNRLSKYIYMYLQL